MNRIYGMTLMPLVFIQPFNNRALDGYKINAPVFAIDDFPVRVPRHAHLNLLRLVCDTATLRDTISAS